MAKTTQAQRDRNEYRNIGVVNDFKNYWVERGADLRQGHTSGLWFQAQINYSSPKASTVEQTDVRISLSGYRQEGTISIDDAGDLVSETYHLGLAAAFGTYALDSSSGELVVSNQSDKMGGKYTVRILPLI